MKITKIQAQIKTRGRYSVFVDDRYSFSLSELALINSGLRTGQELSEEEVIQFKDESQTDKLYNRVLALLARRPRSEWEMREYLKRKCDDPSQIEKILNKLSIAGFVNDQDFAKRWVESRRLLKSISKRKLRLELMQKRIPGSIIDKVLSEDETDELAVLEELIAKKRRNSQYQDETKLMQFLSRQGFSYDQIKQALKKD